MKEILYGVLLAALILPSACKKPDVTSYTESGKAEVVEQPAEHAKEQPKAVSAKLTWKAPKKWKERGSSGMRQGSFYVPANGSLVDLSIIRLPGTAGGPLENANRWRRQMGLSAFDAKGLAENTETVKSPAGTFSVVEFGKPGSSGGRIIAGTLIVGGDSWFFKLRGGDKPTAAAKKEFMAFLATVSAE